ncbi:hypothetical protein Stsp02_73200 [Streptomyces sp. NBRC 14336]|nr:hypothetical protein Stsp02_73200 [Streptomyces sp. NBRC 14336]
MRREERLITEAKGRTQEKGIDADIAYGQLLRRKSNDSALIRYALAVSTSALWQAERVPARTGACGRSTCMSDGRRPGPPPYRRRRYGQRLIQQSWPGGHRTQHRPLHSLS